MTNTEKTPLRVAIGGLGAVGLDLARRLDAGIEGLRLTAVSARDHAAAGARIGNFRRAIPVLPLTELAEHAEVVVECAPAQVFAELATPVLKAGRMLVAISAGALLPNWHLVELARDHGGRIIVPSGALPGLDAVRAAAQGEIRSVRLLTRKPPAGLAGAPYLIANNINLDKLSEPLRVFAGSAREGAAGFPANVNVAAALALAGAGPDRTELEIWADPTVERNTHVVEVDADSARLSLKIENVPSEANPRTGKIVAQSVVAALRTLVDPLVVGA